MFSQGYNKLFYDGYDSLTMLASTATNNLSDREELNEITSKINNKGKFIFVVVIVHDLFNLFCFNYYILTYFILYQDTGHTVTLLDSNPIIEIDSSPVSDVEELQEKLLFSPDSTYVTHQSSNAPSTNDTPIRFSSVLPTLTLGLNGHNYHEGVVPNLAYRTTAAAFAASPLPRYMQLPRSALSDPPIRDSATFMRNNVVEYSENGAKSTEDTAKEHCSIITVSESNNVVVNENIAIHDQRYVLTLN